VARAGAARPPGAARAAGDSCRRHQRQGARPSRSCARCWKPRARAYMSIRRPIWWRVNERFRLGGVPGERRRACRCARRMRGAPMISAPITIFRDRDRSGLRAVRAPIRPTCCCSKSASAGGSTPPNVIERPLASVVTPISMDHIEFLGDTLEKIAAEKGRHLPPRRAGRDRAAESHGVRRAGSHRRKKNPRARCMSAGPALDRAYRARPASSIRTSRGCSTCRRPSCSAAISSTMPARRSRALRAAGIKLSRAGDRGRADARRMAGPVPASSPAESSRRSRPRGRRTLARRRTQCGWRGARSRPALGESGGGAFSRPLVMIVGMLSTKGSRRVSCAISPGWCGG